MHTERGWKCRSPHRDPLKEGVYFHCVRAGVCGSCYTVYTKVLINNIKWFYVIKGLIVTQGFVDIHTHYDGT